MPTELKCQNCKKEFTIDSQDVEFYEKIGVLPPTWCPECRLIRRLNTYNKRVLYKRKCDLCNKSIISVYPSDTKFKVFCPKCWWSDKWDPLDYGRKFDPSIPFLEQLKKLIEEVPHMALIVDYPTMINSDFCNSAGDLKNCYLVFHADFVEDSFYCDSIETSKDCFDSFMINDSELCYEGVNLYKCYDTFFSDDCDDCYDIYFSKNLVGCSHCFGCINLKSKQYCIFNKQYSRDEYFEKIKEFDIGSYKNLVKIYKKAKEFWFTHPSKFMYGQNNINVSGDYIENSKNVLFSFQVENGENLKYCSKIYINPTRDCYDYTSWGNNAQLVYESQGVGDGISNIKFSYDCWTNCTDLQYCISCMSSSNLFGCIGMRKRQYCILNRQYSKEEYQELVPKIIRHINQVVYKDKKGREYKYGEFLPPELSQFSYNETMAQEYFPLTKEEAIKQGYSWKEFQKRDINPDISWKEIPDHIKDADSGIINKLILCKAWDENPQEAQRHNCTKVFKIIPQEYNFYKKKGLPLPRYCPNSRYSIRIQQRNPMKLWKRKCQCGGLGSDNGVYSNSGLPHKPHRNDQHCPVEFLTAYSSDRKEIIYCQDCYQNETA